MTVSLQELKKSYSGATAPSSPVTGQLWDDTSVTPSVLRKYNGSSWASVARTGSADNYADFQARAEMIRKVTPSGFSEFGKSTDLPLSSAEGLFKANPGVSWDLPNYLAIGNGSHSSGKRTTLVVNGYTLVFSGLHTSDVTGDLIQNIELPAPPSSGSRQDLVFLEAWIEEVSKSDGIFFPFGNTQYTDTSAPDGATAETNPYGGAFSGSAYFTVLGNVRCVEAFGAPEEFINNPDHNIGVLENGNFFQVRYRIRVEAGVNYAGQGLTLWQGSGGFGDCLKPQGQLASSPSRGTGDGQDGVFIYQIPGETAQMYSYLDDAGIYVGGKTDAAGNTPISGVSLDGFTYAVPICAIHRRNTGAYGLDNINGCAKSDSWIVSFTDPNMDRLQPHGHTDQSLVTIGSTKYKVLETNGTTGIARMQHFSGPVVAPTGTGSHSYNGAPEAFVFSSPETDDGRFVSTSGLTIHTRPDSLYSDILDRRDVLDLRHSVSLSGSVDEDFHYQETRQLLTSGDYRQEWEEVEAFDNDGNGNSLIESKIYGNVNMQSLGLGATVPDAGENTNITRKLQAINGTPIAFNGAHVKYSDQALNEDLLVVIEDQSDGSANRTHCAEDLVVSYNATTHSIEMDLTQHSSYINNDRFDPTFLDGFTPDIRWGNGRRVAGQLTRTSRYSWNFEVKQYGAIVLSTAGAQVSTSNRGGIYSDNNGNRWIFITGDWGGIPYAVGGIATGHAAWFMPDYDSGNDGDVLPDPTATFTKVSGQGADTFSGFQFVTRLASTGTYTADTSAIGLDAAFNHLWSGYGQSGINAGEPIFAKFKVSYKNGSSCLTEDAYSEEVIGGQIFIDGEEVVGSGNVKVTAKQFEKDTNTLSLAALHTSEYAFTGTLKLVESASLILAKSRQDLTLKSFASYEDYLHDEGTDLVNPVANYGSFVGGGTPQNYSNIVKVGAQYVMYTWSQAGSCNIWSLHSTDLVNWTVGNSGSPVLTGMYAIDSVNIIYEAGFRVLVGWHTGSSVYPRYYLSAGVDNTLILQGDCVSRGYTDAISATAHVTSVQGLIKDGPVYKSLMRPLYTGDWCMAISTDLIHWDFTSIGPNSLSMSDFHRFGKSYRARVDGAQGILAMSASVEEYSATGVFANANPQVNMGFKSTDTLVLHYESLAEQGSADHGGLPELYEPRELGITAWSGHGSKIPSYNKHLGPTKFYFTGRGEPVLARVLDTMNSYLSENIANFADVDEGTVMFNINLSRHSYNGPWELNGNYMRCYNYSDYAEAMIRMGIPNIEAAEYHSDYDQPTLFGLSVTKTNGRYGVSIGGYNNETLSPIYSVTHLCRVLDMVGRPLTK